jgi:hypothetical protein
MFLNAGGGTLGLFKEASVTFSCGLLTEGLFDGAYWG